jgi:hypothetical protein
MHGLVVTNSKCLRITAKASKKTQLSIEEQPPGLVAQNGMNIGLSIMPATVTMCIVRFSTWEWGVKTPVLVKH